MKTNTTRKNPTPAIASTIIMDAEERATGVQFTFASGETRSIMLSELSPELLAHAATHGLKQKVADAAAISRDIDTGLSATATDKEDAATEVIDRLKAPAGTWNKERTGSEGTGGSNSLLLLALMEVTGRDKDAVVSILDSKTKEEKAILRLSPKVAAAILEIQQRRKPVSDDVLGDFMA